MTNLASDIAVRSQFYLAKPDPIVSTIEVYVNVQITSQGWVYDGNDNKIQFNNNISLTMPCWILD